MKRSYALLLLLVCATTSLLANGVGVLDAGNAIYLRLDSSYVHVTVEGQISITTATQYFTNTHPSGVIKYGFPLPEEASAIGLRWRINGTWFTASIAGAPQDTVLPGGGSPSPDLLTFLGKTPLFFPIPDSIRTDSTLAVELTYVELLPYSLGNVTYAYPGDYHLIQTGAILIQKLDFALTSQRTIGSIAVLSHHQVKDVRNTGDTATVSLLDYEHAGDQNYVIRYTLNAQQLGLFAFSTALPDSLVPDSLGGGFLTFIAEPDPGTTTRTIAKVFTLIIDRSGSMGGDKIVQARNAASFIVQNLNEGDKFNLIDFDDIITSFRPTHVLYTPQARDSALAYISTLFARGSTSISGVFSTAVPQFAVANDSTANIIIFLTDGQPTYGIVNTDQLVQHVDTLIQHTETRINLFCFGIGGDVNFQLLTLMARHNRGIAEFLGNDELYARITDFYLTIRNPVLLNSQISFVPPVVSEVYPDSLPNLYKGKQMIVAARYQHAQTVHITLSGTAYDQPVSYSYDIQLEGSPLQQNQFLPKIWAKRKIESLLVRYYGLYSLDPVAVALRSQIIAISRAYGVISPFTSFSGGGGTGGGGGGQTAIEEVQAPEPLHPGAFELLGNYPNPFNPSTTIRVRLSADYTGPLEVRIYNTLGQIVRTLRIQAHGKGVYEIVWEGLAEGGGLLSSGVYFYGIELRNTVLIGKMIMLK
jgi:Ca-activated chloride channel family protein